jgi:hypothetical protein
MIASTLLSRLCWCLLPCVFAVYRRISQHCGVQVRACISPLCSAGAPLSAYPMALPGAAAACPRLATAGTWATHQHSIPRCAAVLTDVGRLHNALPCHDTLDSSSAVYCSRQTMNVLATAGSSNKGSEMLFVIDLIMFVLYSICPLLQGRSQSCCCCLHSLSWLHCCLITIWTST